MTIKIFPSSSGFLLSSQLDSQQKENTFFPHKKSSKGPGEKSNWLCSGHMTIPDPITLVQENKARLLVRPEMCVLPGAKGKVSPT